MPVLAAEIQQQQQGNSTQQPEEGTKWVKRQVCHVYVWVATRRFLPRFMVDLHTLAIKSR